MTHSGHQTLMRRNTIKRAHRALQKYAFTSGGSAKRTSHRYASSIGPSLSVCADMIFGKDTTKTLVTQKEKNHGGR
jgi:hypothetical protein